MDLPLESVCHNRGYFVVVVAVGKLESGFSLSYFSIAFSIWHAPSTLRSLRLLRPVLFVLHRADVIQCRMKSCLVIPEQPIEGFIFGLTKSFKVQAVQPFHLQGSEQRLATRVIPAVAFATHRS